MTPERLTYFLDRLTPKGLKALEEYRIIAFGQDLLNIDDNLSTEEMREIFQALRLQLGLTRRRLGYWQVPLS